MPISTSCLTNALSPFVPGPFDLIPTEKIEDWLNPARMLAKASASRYGLRESEFSIFEDWWALSQPARELHKSNEAAAQAEIEAAFGRLKAIVDDGAEYEQLGYRHVSRAPGSGRYVVFSDHHMAFPGSRQDFFKSSGNSELYGEILGQYADAGFTLVENGDVEELIIHEPSLPSPALSAQARADWRLVQLGQVIANHRELYAQINEQFVEPGRYVRIAGNHDQDLQQTRFLDVLRSVYPGLEQVYDFLILEATDDSDARYVIGHGHHFDKASTPKYAAQVGEMLSECLGWAYEGADRVWRWDGTDGVQRWAGGGEAFLNTLVTDDPDRPIPIDLDVEGALITWLQSFGLISPWAALGGVTGVVGALLAQLSKESLSRRRSGPDRRTSPTAPW
jgi:hypothetical protein